MSCPPVRHHRVSGQVAVGAEAMRSWAVGVEGGVDLAVAQHGERAFPGFVLAPVGHESDQVESLARPRSRPPASISEAVSGRRRARPSCQRLA